MKQYHASEVEAVRRTRRSVSMIRRGLLKPTVEALDACAPHLQNALESIDRLQSLFRVQESTPDGVLESLRMEIVGLRRDLSQVTALMHTASGFYGGLVRLLSPQEDDLTGYVQSGSFSTRAKPTLQLEG